MSQVIEGLALSQPPSLYGDCMCEALKLRSLKPPLHSLGAESDEVPQLAVRQALLAKRGHVPHTASRVSGHVVDGPERGFDGSFRECIRRRLRWVHRPGRHVNAVQCLAVQLRTVRCATSSRTSCESAFRFENCLHLITPLQFLAGGRQCDMTSYDTRTSDSCHFLPIT